MQHPNLVPLFGGKPVITTISYPDAKPFLDNVALNVLEALEEAPMVNVQDWCEDILIVVTAVKVIHNIHTVFTIGRPTAGEYLHSTNDPQEAVKILQTLTGQEAE